MPSSAEPALLLFSAADALRAWPRLAEHMAGLEERTSGRYTPEAARDAVARAAWQAWAIVRGSDVLGAALTEVTTYPTGLRELFVVWLGGRDMRSWLHLTSEMEETARMLGCSLMAWQGRPGWQRAQAGYRAAWVAMEKAL